jgi:hypothetical protein
LIRVVLADANPTSVVEAFGIEVLTPDQLLGWLVAEYEPQMLAVHRMAVESLKGATDESTVAALRRSGASTTAGLIASLLGIQ